MRRPRGHQEAVLVEPKFGVYGTCGGCGADVLYYWTLASSAPTATLVRDLEYPKA